MMKIIVAMVLLALVGCVKDEDVEIVVGQNVLESQEFPIEIGEVFKVSTIGDSRFISHGGAILRKAIEKNSEKDLLFVGSMEDKYGYSHDAKGGDNSQDLMDRYYDIPDADLYVIMFGTNDGSNWSNENTLTLLISDKLSQGKKVYYCIQTPRYDGGDNQHVLQDAFMIDYFQGVEGFEVVDLRTPMFNEDGDINDDLYHDHVHPNNDGTKVMGREIANKIDETN